MSLATRFLGEELDSVKWPSCHPCLHVSMKAKVDELALPIAVSPVVQRDIGSARGEVVGGKHP